MIMNTFHPLMLNDFARGDLIFTPMTTMIYLGRVPPVSFLSMFPEGDTSLRSHGRMFTTQPGYLVMYFHDSFGPHCL